VTPRFLVCVAGVFPDTVPKLILDLASLARDRARPRPKVCNGAVGAAKLERAARQYALGANVLAPPPTHEDPPVSASSQGLEAE
jgi:hypothetical protein